MTQRSPTDLKADPAPVEPVRPSLTRFAQPWGRATSGPGRRTPSASAWIPPRWMRGQGGRPPRLTAELWQVLQLCVRAGRIVIAQAANTGLTEGSPPKGTYDRPVAPLSAAPACPAPLHQRLLSSRIPSPLPSGRDRRTGPGGARPGMSRLHGRVPMRRVHHFLSSRYLAGQCSEPACKLRSLPVGLPPRPASAGLGRLASAGDAGGSDPALRAAG